MKNLLVLILVLLAMNLKSFGQYKSLTESPMFKKNKVNLFQDTATNTIYSLSRMDSLYQAGKAKFQIYNYKAKADSIYWQIRFITELSTIRPKWIGKKFPLKAFTDIGNNSITIDALKGKILIINCWSVTCGPCVKEIPALNKLTDSLDKRGFVFLALTYDKLDEIKKFFASEKLKIFLNTPKPEFKFQIIADQMDYLNNQLEITSYPATFIVDRNGIIKEVLEGVNLDEKGNPKSFEEIKTAISKL